MRFIFIMFMAVALYPNATSGQCTSSQQRPFWIDGFTKDAGCSYIELVSAEGYNEDNARNKAAQQIIERRNLGAGQRVNITVKNGTIQVDGKEALTVKARILDEYREHCESGQYRVSLLVQTAQNPTCTFEPVNITDKYPFSPRVFVPGMAQLHKGSTGKGIFFIVGEVAMVGGVVAFEALRSSAESKIGTTHNATDRQNYIDDASNMQNLRNGFIAGAVAFYAWNVIDGIAAKGKKHIQIGNADLRIMPYATPYVSGVSLALKF